MADGLLFEKLLNLQNLLTNFDEIWQDDTEWVL